MINKLIHALSNRKGPFNTPAFVVDPDFKPTVITREEQKLRDLLFLNVTTTDYYLKAYLACLEAFPDIKALADDDVVSYKLSDFTPRGVEISGGELLSKANSVGYYRDLAPMELPVDLTWRLHYSDAHHIRVLALETGLVRNVSYTVSGTVPNQTLRINWPDDVPFDGPVSLQQVWGEGAAVEILVEPSAFPYQLLVDRLRSNGLLMRLLIDNKFVDEYTAFPDPQRRIALACICLALANPSVYPV